MEPGTVRGIPKLSNIVFRRCPGARPWLPVACGGRHHKGRSKVGREAGGKLPTNLQHLVPRSMVHLPVLLDEKGGQPACGVLLLGGAPALATAAATGLTWHPLPPDAMLLAGCRMHHTVAKQVGGGQASSFSSVLAW